MKTTITTYHPEPDDGDTVFAAVIAAISENERDDIESMMMEKVVAPTLKTVLDLRSEHDVTDEDFFLAFSSIMADTIGILTEAVVSDGKEDFVVRVLRVISAILAHKIGTGVIPEKSEVMDIIRRAYN